MVVEVQTCHSILADTLERGRGTFVTAGRGRILVSLLGSTDVDEEEWIPWCLAGVGQ